MKIRALQDYRDLQKEKDIVAGEEYIVTLERGNQIIAKGYAEEVKEPEEKKAEPKKEEPKKKPSFNIKDKSKK